ncbi:hypothetical protein TRFO_13323 [Tritrichomonas foetus]|uniref:PRP1 splicing factor N-terminal domain-containing protein n=1 Tax=Tritrichomonas foetus TaxID=1144522 RepID=A0A1J4L2V6_9EUKA|nr:hypothetical protein TRFO_13323 [Tritrichomonas foetus]|eukprot:OHT16308.1 hypothetical protein TRFO_13323 [Tritrichomonas foetus]
MSSYPFPWGPPPPGYVPGLGRGAVAFVNNIETGKVDFETEIRSIKLAHQIKKEEEKANAFYLSVDEQMKNRNKKRQKVEVIPGPKQIFNEIQDQFSDLKEGLKTITENEWENLPEIGATTYHRPKWELYTHASDRMITNDFEDSALNRSIREGDLMTQDTITGDTDNQIMSVARAQRSVLNVQLSKIVPLKNSIDVSQFVQELDNQASNVISQFSDLDRAADLYRVMTHTNKENPQAWLIRERVEEMRGKLDKARKIARDGMINCPQSELLVMEAARLSTRQDATSLIQSALQVNHKSSEKLWLQLVAYQNNINAKKSTLENAIRAIPKSETIWKAAAAIEEGENHTNMLKRGLEFIPESETLWIEGINTAANYEEVMYFVDHGIEQLGENVNLLISWSKADEKFNHGSNCLENCKRAVNSLLEIDWVTEAINAEKEGCFSTAIGIVNSISLENVSTEELIKKSELAENCGCEQTSQRLLYRNALEKGDFYSYLNFEKKYDRLEEAVSLAIQTRPDDENLAIFISEIFSGKRSIPVLESAFERLPNSEIVALALIDAYIESKNLLKAKEFTQTIVNSFNSVKLYLKLAIINEQFGGDELFLRDSIQKFPKNPEFYLLLADHLSEPKEILQQGIKNCPNSGELHITLIKYLINKKVPGPRIRALFEKARRLCSDQPIVWLVSAEFEQPQMRNSLYEEAKEKVPKHQVGMIWARQIEHIDMENRLNFTKETLETIGGTTQSRELTLMLALCFWRRGEVDKARPVFENMSREFPKWGDGWVYRIKFESLCGSPQDLFEAKKAATFVKIEDGILWNNARNKRENFELSQEELLDDLVAFVADPMISDESIFSDSIDIGCV